MRFMRSWSAGLLAVAALGSSRVLAQPATSESLTQWGIDVLSRIRSEFLDPESGLYANELDATGRRSGPAFLWGGGVQLSALVAAASLRPECRPWLDDYATRLQRYWNTQGPVQGYDCLPCPKPVDRYYDDNVWVALAFLEAHESLHDARFLDLARDALTYVLSGMDAKLGGGIYWRESDKASKNTCSNAPSALACYRLAQLTGDREYQAKGDAILDWLIGRLRDPQDLLMWDNIDVASGRIEKTKWSYNTALTFQALALRARLAAGHPDQDRYRTESRAMADAALKAWWDPATATFRGGLKFDHLLADALLAQDRLDGTSTYTPIVAQAARTLHQWAADPKGHYPGQWAARPATPLTKVELIDQASAARTYLSLARALHPQDPEAGATPAPGAPAAR